MDIRGGAIAKFDANRIFIELNLESFGQLMPHHETTIEAGVD